MKRQQLESDDEFNHGDRNTIVTAITKTTCPLEKYGPRSPTARRYPVTSISAFRGHVACATYFIHERDLGGKDRITDAQRGLGRRLAMWSADHRWREALLIKRADDPNRDDEGKLYGQSGSISISHLTISNARSLSTLASIEPWRRATFASDRVPALPRSIIDGAHASRGPVNAIPSPSASPRPADYVETGSRGSSALLSMECSRPALMRSSGAEGKWPRRRCRRSREGNVQTGLGQLERGSPQKSPTTSCPTSQTTTGSRVGCRRHRARGALKQRGDCPARRLKELDDACAILQGECPSRHSEQVGRLLIRLIR